MQHNPKKYLVDIAESIASIEEYLGETPDFESYEQNKLLRRGIEREFEIIGEAMNSLIKYDPEIPISNARRIIDFRNWVIHGYDKVDNMIVWGIILKDLPILKNEVLKLLSK